MQLVPSGAIPLGLFSALLLLSATAISSSKNKRREEMGRVEVLKHFTK